MGKVASFDELLSHFQVAKRQGNTAICHCPSHDDKKGSLNFTLHEDKILGYCFAGCHIADVLGAVNLTLSSLFLNGSKAPSTIFQYRDKDGALHHEKLKYPKGGDDKTFKQRRLAADGSIAYDLEGLSRIPYNYPGVISAIKASDIIICPEGEKDAETARILGYAYTTIGGASDWKPEHKYHFRNAKVVLISDNDAAGISLVQKESTDLTTVCKSVKVVILPEGKDLTEWAAKGHSRADLGKLITEAPELVKPSSGKFDWHNFAIGHDDLLAKDLQPMDFIVEDMLVSCGTGVIAGKKKIGKSWQALQLSQAVASGSDFLGRKVKQGKVVHFALEDGERRTQSRLRMQHTTAGLPITYFYKWLPWNTPEGFNQLRDMIKELKPVLVMVDTFAKCLNAKPDQNSAGEMGDFGNRIHDLALEENTFILFMAHHGKMSLRDPGFDIRGSSAIPGSTDVNIGLYKNEDGTFDLMGEGRDFEEFDVRVKLDKEQTWAWHCLGEAQDIRRVEAEKRIIEALGLLGSADALTIANEIDTTRPNVNMHLKRMREGDNPSVNYRIEGRKIVYSLTSLTVLTDTTSLTSLTDTFSVRSVSDSTLETAQSRSVSDVSDMYKDGKIECFACKGTKRWLTPDGRYLCSVCHPEPQKNLSP